MVLFIRKVALEPLIGVSEIPIVSNCRWWPNNLQPIHHSKSKQLKEIKSFWKEKPTGIFDLVKNLQSNSTTDPKGVTKNYPLTDHKNTKCDRDETTLVNLVAKTRNNWMAAERALHNIGKVPMFMSFSPDFDVLDRHCNETSRATSRPKHRAVRIITIIPHSWSQSGHRTHGHWTWKKSFSKKHKFQRRRTGFKGSFVPSTRMTNEA